ncbi:heavy-metal-associated domain-containing protein [Edaphocola flava]|jgi:copper chaperone|uniref:heavy-metal-associated domain-containing protein n=1 Tax=Edaphocola flava TaxID=2499629 RepID=UPI00100AFA7A|nr:cation transporter [Edaphocola flava]
MEQTLKFKTNINCGGCVAKVQPRLDAEKDIHSWTVDTDNPDKILTVETELSKEDIINLIQMAGFKIETV